MADQSLLPCADDNLQPGGQCPIKLRSYQNEMFERSLESNTIVVMETGSGKTAVAIYRIKHALEHTKDKRLIWFLAGTVQLCRQQHEKVKEAIPYAVTKCIVGEDGPEFWGSAEIWRQVLKGVNIMFSTFAILHDALGHARINIKDLGLLIFDEAHHVTKDHPANCIMQEFYHRTRDEEGAASLPAILGLTASPTQNGKPDNVDQLEANLAATCQAPRAHHLELRRYVNRPSLEMIGYQQTTNVSSGFLAKDNDLLADKRFERIKKKVVVLVEELGWWAGITYIDLLVAVLTKSVRQIPDYLETDSNYRKLELLERLRPFATNLDALYFKAHGERSENVHISDKAKTLITRLNDFVRARPQFTGIVFARERIVVTMLQILLSYHAHVSEDLRSASFVGGSGSIAYKTDPSELLIPRTQARTMQHFRDGKLNLIISTDALDEGIDVAACNTIICFDEPANLRSYIQKRGRARQSSSIFVMMHPEGASKRGRKAFDAMEERITRMFDEEERRARIARALESIEEDMDYTLESPHTGAYLTAKKARAHLHHFCSKLPRIPYTDSSPVFHCTSSNGMIFAKVQLPMSVPSAARTAKSAKGWKTERAAIKDAAFQAYKGLYEHGLLKEDLLPLDMEPNIDDDFTELEQEFEHLGYKMSAWRTNNRTPRLVFRTILTIQSENGALLGSKLVLLTENDLGLVGSIQLLSEKNEIINVDCESAGQIKVVNEEMESTLACCTHTLMKALRAQYQPSSTTRHAVFVIPDLPLNELVQWLELYTPESAAQPYFLEHKGHEIIGKLVVSSVFRDLFAVTKEWHLGEDENGEQVLEIECTQLPKRRNFTKVRPRTHQQDSQLDEQENLDDNIIVPAEDCIIRNIPVGYAVAMRYLPSIFYHIETILTGHRLQVDLLRGVNFGNLPALVQSITCPQTMLQENYERVEFLGDSILKFHTTCQLYGDYPSWHEGFLTRERNTFVSNASLANAAVRCGLDKFILLEPFQGKHWSIPSQKDIEMKQQMRRYLRMKLVADVVEALIGAAFLGGGLESARHCMSIISPDIRREASKFPKLPEPASVSGSTLLIERAESILDYTFCSKYLLLEALTHPSCANTGAESYQRLEFLGDAVLELIVVTELFELLPDSSQNYLTKMKAALVNGNFLAFLCYSLSIELESTTYSARGRYNFKVDRQLESVSLSSLLRRDGDIVSDAHREGWARFEELRDSIAEGLRSGPYPWEQLCSLKAPKFVSDIVESLLGGIFVDSNGSLEQCRGFLKKIGLMDQLSHTVSACVDVTHPQERLRRMTPGCNVEHEWEISEDSNKIALTIMMDGKEAARVVNCSSKDEAIIKAAAAACKSLGRG